MNKRGICCEIALALHNNHLNQFIMLKEACHNLGMKYGKCYLLINENGRRYEFQKKNSVKLCLPGLDGIFTKQTVFYLFHGPRSDAEIMQQISFISIRCFLYCPINSKQNVVKIKCCIN